MTNASAWLQASRPAAAINLLLPLTLGQALAFRHTGLFSFTLCLLLLLYGLLMQLYIVFLNDWADQQADALNSSPTLFSGGSRVLLQKKMPARNLLYAGLGAGISTLAIGFAFSVFYSRPWMPALFFAGLLLLWAYSLPPLRLNYRGGGELLQALGVGLILPIAAFYAQTNHLHPLPWPALLPYFLLQLSAAIAFTLPDRTADQRAGKRTLATHLSTKKAAAIAVALGLLSHLLLFLQHAQALSAYLPPLPLLAALYLISHYRESRSYLLILTMLLIAPAMLFALTTLYSIF
jgi:1,4-dihydroxy-2-naphthoate octaprenyltransferase